MSTFKRDTLAYGMAVTVDRLIGLMLLPLLTGGLDQSDFAVWSQIQSVYGFFSTALLLGFYHTISSLAANRPATEAGSVYAGVLGIVSLSTGLFLAACALWPGALSRGLFAEGAYAYVIPAVGWFTATECFYEMVVLAILRSQGRIVRGALLHGAKSLARLVLVYAGLHAGDPLVVILGALGLVNAVFVGYVLWRYTFPDGIPSPRLLGRKFWSGAVAGAVVTACAVLIAWGNSALNRFLIVHFAGLHELAIYSANYSILSMVTLVPMIVNFTLLHHLSVQLAAGAVAEARELISRSLAYYIYVTLPLLILVGLFYDGLLGLLTPGGYGGGVLLPATLGAYFFVFGIEQMLVFSTFPTSGARGLAARGVALALNLVAGAVLVPTLGFAYAAVPMIAASVLVVALCSMTLREQVGHRFPWHTTLKLACAALVMLGAGALLCVRWQPTGWSTIAYESVLLGFIYLLAEGLMPGSLTRQLLVRPVASYLLEIYRKRPARR
jgi:O-antigen/teichoic acid export membrane protein